MRIEIAVHASCEPNIASAGKSVSTWALALEVDERIR